MAKSVGNKLTPYLPQIVPLLSQLMTALDQSQSVDRDNELSEACLSTLQAILRKCPKDVTQFVNGLLRSSIELLKYDPNYVYDEDDGDEAMEEEEDAGGWGSDFSDDDGQALDDDDDTSWKVRRGAISVIDAIIKTRPDLAREIT